MMFSPNFVQGVSFFLSSELLASLIIYGDLKPDRLALYVREVGLIILSASIPTMIYLSIFYITKLVLLVSIFATITVTHITILMLSKREYINSGVAAIMGFIVGVFLFGWGVVAGILVLIAAKYYEIRLEIPKQTEIGLRLVKGKIIFLLFIVNCVVTLLAFIGLI